MMYHVYYMQAGFPVYRTTGDNETIRRQNMRRLGDYTNLGRAYDIARQQSRKPKLQNSIVGVYFDGEAIRFYWRGKAFNPTPNNGLTRMMPVRRESQPMQ